MNWQGGRCLASTLVLVPTKADPFTKERSCKRGDGIVNALTLPREKEVDHEARIVKSLLELANLKQGETEHCWFYCPSRHFSEKAPWFSGRGWFDPEHKKRLLFQCARSKSFTFGNVKTLVKALYFSRGKDSPFDPAYKELRSVGSPSPIQSTEELVRQCNPALEQGVRILNSTLIHGPLQSFTIISAAVWLTSV